MQVRGIHNPSLKFVINSLLIQVKDSLPYIKNYIPLSIKNPEELFYFLKDKVVYKKDPSGKELLQTVQTLMERGGRGDCDCFTILTLAACQYLGFKPQYIVLVGRTKQNPTHIYSKVYDKQKGKVCAMDLTNPTYCMERQYPYKQIIPIDNMELVLEDNYNPFSLSAKPKKVLKKQEKQKRVAVKKTAKTAKKVAKVTKKVARKEGKTARKVARQDRRTDRVVQKGQRKELKRAAKVQKKQNVLTKRVNKGELIKARQEGRLQNVKSGNMNPDGEYSNPFVQGEGEYEIPFMPGSAGEEQAQAFSPDFDPGVEADMIPDIYGDQWQGGEEDTEDAEFEVLPDGEDLNDGLSGIITDTITGIKKLVQKGQDTASKISSSKVGRAAQQGYSTAQELLNAKQKVKEQEKEIAALKNERYYFAAGGTLAGILLKSTILK